MNTPPVAHAGIEVIAVLTQRAGEYGPRDNQERCSGRYIGRVVPVAVAVFQFVRFGMPVPYRLVIPALRQRHIGE